MAELVDAVDLKSTEVLSFVPVQVRLPAPWWSNSGRIAQLVRVPARHAGGQWFKSTCAHHKIFTTEGQRHGERERI